MSKRTAPKLLNREPISLTHLNGRIGLNTPDPYHEVKLEVIHTREQVTRIWLNGRRTPFKIATTVPHSEYVVLSYFINYWIGFNLFKGVPTSIEEIKQTLSWRATLDFWGYSSIGNCYLLVKK